MTGLPTQPELRRSYEVVIVGGGVHGLSLAYHLAKSGRRSVAVFERGYVGVGAVVGTRTAAEAFAEGLAAVARVAV